MYKLALKEQRLKSAPFIGLLEERNTRKGFLRDAEYEALARETAKAGLWLRAMFEIAYTFGWRKSELTGMRVSQVDLIEATIELNPGETKNDQARLVTTTARIRGLLSQCITGKGSADLVFTRDDGRRVGNFRRAWSKACHDAGVDGLLFHDLRRTAVRNMRRRGIPEKVAMQISGHRTRAVFERYNIVDAADLKQAVAALERGAVAPAEVQPA
jgi:integrase